MDKSLQLIYKNSRALSRFLNKHPKLAKEISKYVTKTPSKIIAYFEKDFELEGVSTNPSRSLRLFKYKTLCALAIQHLVGKIDAEKFCSSWSRVAEKCCQIAYDFTYRETLQELGEPIVINEHGNESKFRFTVIALGKLGAGELNLSSDIDLLFLYNSNSGLIRKGTNKTLHEFANKTAQKITSILSNVDTDGFCFRVDNDLRPEGKRGPLTNSIDAAVNYYEFGGSELERMMLIRANPIAGDIELGLEFIEQIKPFVYRRNLDISSLKKIREMKRSIEQEALKSIKDGLDIKRGDGGIREVEFVIQSIQLLHGGKDKKLIAKNTFKAIDAIRKKKLIPSKQCNQLKDAYLFLRHLENMIQLPGEEQTHILPSDPNQRENLALMMGYKSTDKTNAADTLMTDFDEATDIVKHHFRHIFETNIEKKQMEDAILTNISTCLDSEEEVDSLPWFKKEETKRIQYMDLQQDLGTTEVSEKLTLVAEVIISEAYKLASHNLRMIYGPPLSKEKGHPISSLAIIGVGKLGGGEIDYASDLDLMFVFSDSGHTAGPQKITNQEYFTKLSQRIITLITLTTRYGKAYQIDTDLRPSGRAGILVSSLSSFKSYHNIEADFWERQALLKARAIAGDPQFCETINKTLDELRYDRVLPPDFKEKIYNLRMRMEKERAVETESRLNIKLGPGGLMDIETIVQYLQIKHGSKDDTLRSNNTLLGLRALGAKNILDTNTVSNLVANYIFLRRLLSRIRLYLNHAVDYLDLEMNQINQIAESLGFKDKDLLIEKYLEKCGETRKIYESYFE